MTAACTRLLRRAGGVVVILIALVALGAAPAAAGPSTYSVSQGDDCFELAAVGDGTETVEAFYDYRSNETTPKSYYYSSYGTAAYQETQQSNLFIYDGASGRSLVFLHDEFGDSPGGGSVSMELSGLPADGEWAVQDDRYGNESQDDRWNVTETTTSVEWVWSDDRNDGGAYRLNNESFTIQIDSAFNENTARWESWRGSGSENDKITSWIATSGNGTEHELERGVALTIEPGPCETIAPANATVSADGNSSVGSTVTFDASASTGHESIQEYQWDIGTDGTVEAVTTEPTLEHKFDSPGTHSMSVTVVDSIDQTESATIQVQIDDNDSPTARVSVPETVKAGEEFSVSASNVTDSSSIAHLRWLFDSELGEYARETTHTFEEAGTHTATLQIVDAAGNEQNITREITVEGRSNSSGDDGGGDGDGGSSVGQPGFGVGLTVLSLLLATGVLRRRLDGS